MLTAHRVSRRIVVSVISLATLLLPACADVNIHSGDLSVKLNQQSINEAIKSTVLPQPYSTGKTVMTELTAIQFIEPNTIRATGKNEEAYTSVDIQVGAENGALKMNIASINAPGFDASTSAIQKANEGLTNAFSAQLEQNSQGRIKAARVVGDALELVISIDGQMGTAAPAQAAQPQAEAGIEAYRASR